MIRARQGRDTGGILGSTASTPHRPRQETAMRFAYTIVSPDGGYGELDTGATTLSFARHDVARGSLGGGYVAADGSARPLGVEVGLACDDVAAAYERALAAGATGLKPPTVKPWGQTVAYVRCPDGTLVELCTPMG
jgi:lactoylglutathione lyase